MKIGVYGGTFNPPHLGHVTAARAVFELLKLDLLLLVPDREPPHKALPAGSPTPEQRLEMTRLAGEQLGLGDRVQVLDLELKRDGAELYLRHPGPAEGAVPGGRAVAADGHGHVPHHPDLARSGEDSVPGGDRHLRPNGGGHGGAVLRSAGLSVPDISPGPDLHPHHPRRGGCVLHRPAEPCWRRERA